MGMTQIIPSQDEVRARASTEPRTGAYAQWLGNGLASADIRRLDPKLYQSLRVWICTKGRPKDFDLPSKSRKIGERIVHSGLARNIEGDKVLRRIDEAQRARRKKAKRSKR